MHDTARSLITILFTEGGPVEDRVFKDFFKLSDEEYVAVYECAREMLEPLSIWELLHVNETLALVSHSHQSTLLHTWHKNEETKPLSSAVMNTLAIIVYSPGISKSDIDSIRGVNSVHTLRTLMMRGLIERREDPADKRSSSYVPTLETYQYLGIPNSEALPDYHTFHSHVSSLTAHPENNA
jgi:chromosome segregation and condensation protein ScpB